MWLDSKTRYDDPGRFDGLIRHSHLMAWLCLFGFVGYVMFMVLT